MTQPARADIEIVNADGSTSVAETMALLFYSRTPHLQMLEPVAQTIRAFAKLVSFSALNAYYDDEGDEQELDQATLDALIDRHFFAPDRYQNANLTFVGGGFHARHFFLNYSGTAIDNPEVPDEASYLWCWVPRRFFLENRERFMTFVSETSARLPFTSGYVNPALAGENKFRMQALGWRHPGLDLARPLVVSADIAGKAAGAYWLNFTGPELSAMLGGLAAIRAALPPEIAVDDIGQGKCRIMLGPEPELGDVNRRDFLPNHQAFARFLESKGVLHVPERAVYFVDADNAADRDAMVRWHRRFLP